MQVVDDPLASFYSFYLWTPQFVFHPVRIKWAVVRLVIIRPPRTELSQKLGFSMSHVGGWAFRTVRLQEEPAARRTAIQRAFESSVPPKKEPNQAPEPTRSARGSS